MYLNAANSRRFENIKQTHISSVQLEQHCNTVYVFPEVYVIVLLYPPS